MINIPEIIKENTNKDGMLNLSAVLIKYCRNHKTYFLHKEILNYIDKNNISFHFQSEIGLHKKDKK